MNSVSTSTLLSAGNMSPGEMALVFGVGVILLAVLAGLERKLAVFATLAGVMALLLSSTA